MGKYYSVIECELSENDMDGNGHFAAHYFDIKFQKGKKDLFDKSGVGIEELAQRELAFFERTSRRKHIRQVPPTAKSVEIRSCFEPYERGPFVTIKQEMLYQGEVVAITSARYIFVDRKNNDRALRAPPEDLQHHFT